MRKTLILKGLKEFGLSDYEAKCYLSLLERDTLTVSEISKLAGIPRTNAYEALEKLMLKGMSISRPGRIKKYSASDPLSLKEKFLMQANETTEIELKNLHEKEKEILEKNRSVKNIINEMIKELGPLYDNSKLNTNPLDYIEILKDPYQIHKKYIKLLNETKEGILAFTKPPFSGPTKKLEEQVDQQKKIMNRPIQIRCIYEIPKDKDQKKWCFEMIERSISDGEKARVLKELPMKMAVFDSRIVLLSFEDPVSKQTSLTTLIIEHHSLAKGFGILFDTLWAQAEDYHISKFKEVTP